MGVSVYAYRGAQLEEVGATLSDFTTLVKYSEATHAHIELESVGLKPEELETGIYAILGKFEERIGSYKALDEFRQSLASLLNTPYPDPTGTWNERPFGELLYATDSNVVMGPRMLESFHHNLENYSEEAAQKLAPEHYETYQLFQKAVNFAREDIDEEGDGVGILTVH